MSAINWNENNNTDTSKGIVISVAAHACILSFFILKAVFFDGTPLEYQATVRVDIVGLPDKLPSKIEPLSESAQAQAKKEEAAIKELQEQLKSKPELPNKSKSDDSAINIDKSKSTDRPKDKTLDAINKLKALDAIDKIKQDLENSKKKLSHSGEKNIEGSNVKIKGNVISPGTSLTGLSRLQMDDYQGLLDAHVKKHWFVPEWLAKKKYKAIARVFVDNRGTVIGKKMEKPSGNSSFDESVMQTIDASSPFPVPPEKLSAKTQYDGILFEFGSDE